jgi:hypothetical protein
VLINKELKELRELKELKTIVIMATYSFENVIVWQKAHQFALLAYRATQKFPITERYGLY